MDDLGENTKGHEGSRNNRVGGRGTDEDNQSKDEPGSLNERKKHKLFLKKTWMCSHGAMRIGLAYQQVSFGIT